MIYAFNANYLQTFFFTFSALFPNFWSMNQIEKQLIEIYSLLNQLEDEGKDWTALYKKHIEKAFQLEQKIINGK